MEQTLKRTKLLDRVFFNAVRDEKFKSNRISVNLITTLHHETAAQNAIVPFILRKGYAGCPDFTELNRRLASLYGAALDADEMCIRDSFYILHRDFPIRRKRWSRDTLLQKKLLFQMSG